jgi:hypothetical protein
LKKVLTHGLIGFAGERLQAKGKGSVPLYLSGFAKI